MTVDADTTLNTTSGPIRGTRSRGVRAFKGVQFASAGRFRQPQPPAPWTDTLDCRASGPVAPQLSGGTVLGTEEGCLTVSVWTPDGAAEGALPVLFWIHGGAFLSGAGSDYDGASLARRGQAVIVAVNYRLGPLGFLRLDQFGEAFAGACNLALADVLAAFDWARANVASLGGDPDRITLCGQSAGASLVTTLITLPVMHGRVSGAIILSGPGGRLADRGRAATVADRFLAELGIAGDQSGQLLDRPVRQLLEAGTGLAGSVAGHVTPGGLWGPLVDGALVTRQPLDALRAGAAKATPLWFMSCRDEMAMFMQSHPPARMVAETEQDLRTRFGADGWDRLVRVHTTAAEKTGGDPMQDLQSEGRWHRPMRQLAAAQAQAGGAVWVSRFDHAPGLLPFASQGPTHGADNACLWAHLPDFIGRPVLGRAGGPMTLRDVEVTARLQAAVMRFVADRAPEPGTGWEPYNGAPTSIAIFGHPHRRGFGEDDAVEETWRELEAGSPDPSV